MSGSHQDGVVDPCYSFFNTLVSVECQEGSPDIGLLYMPQCKGCAPYLYAYGILIDGFTKAGGTNMALELYKKNAEKLNY